MSNTNIFEIEIYLYHDIIQGGGVELLNALIPGERYTIPILRRTVAGTYIGSNTTIEGKDERVIFLFEYGDKILEFPDDWAWKFEYAGTSAITGLPKTHLGHDTNAGTAGYTARSSPMRFSPKTAVKQIRSNNEPRFRQLPDKRNIK